ncbi:MAG: hypothetical protein K1X81_05805 [Bacteroidia bacterium]|nr:hypothetical protein [Bacteroidia bacterium]
MNKETEIAKGYGDNIHSRHASEGGKIKKTLLIICYLLLLNDAVGQSQQIEYLFGHNEKNKLCLFNNGEHVIKFDQGTSLTYCSIDSIFKIDLQKQVLQAMNGQGEKVLLTLWKSAPFLAFKDTFLELDSLKAYRVVGVYGEKAPPPSTFQVRQYLGGFVFKISYSGYDLDSIDIITSNSHIHISYYRYNKGYKISKIKVSCPNSFVSWSYNFKNCFSSFLLYNKYDSTGFEFYNKKNKIDCIVHVHYSKFPNAISGSALYKYNRYGKVKRNYLEVTHSDCNVCRRL